MEKQNERRSFIKFLFSLFAFGVTSILSFRRKGIILFAAFFLFLPNATLGSQSFQITGVQLSTTPTLNLPVTFTVSADQPNLYYQFWLSPYYGSSSCGAWQIIQAWSGYNYCTWTPRALGRSVLVVWVKDNPSASDYEIIGFSFEVESLNVNLSGTYSGTETGTDTGYNFTAQVTVTIFQNGTNLSGTWTSSYGASGTLTGTILGNSSFSIELTQTNPCWGHFSGSGSILNNGGTLSGSGSGNYCDGWIQASFTVTRR